MKRIINFTTTLYDTDRYRDNADLKAFYRELGFDGLELMRLGDNKNGIVTAEDVIGIHMRYFTTWMDLWTGDEGRLLSEFGDYDAVRQTYGGTIREALTQAFVDDLNAPPRVLPEYLVFHVSECNIAESILRRYHYGSEAVIDAVIELTYSFREAVQGSPALLFENLWYPGLNMLEPDMTFKLLEKAKYPNVGVMLDMGHLLNTNTALRAIDEGIEYIHRVLDLYGDLAFIKGVHLHQSLSGEYAEGLMRTWTPPDGSYDERRRSVFPHIFKIDTHRPFASERVNELIERIQPEYLTIEQLSPDRFEHARNLKEQLRYLKSWPNH
jgi:hypothetical protein